MESRQLGLYLRSVPSLDSFGRQTLPKERSAAAFADVEHVTVADSELSGQLSGADSGCLQLKQIRDLFIAQLGTMARLSGYWANLFGALSAVPSEVFVALVAPTAAKRFCQFVTVDTRAHGCDVVWWHQQGCQSAVCDHVALAAKKSDVIRRIIASVCVFVVTVYGGGDAALLTGDAIKRIQGMCTLAFCLPES